MPAIARVSWSSTGRAACTSAWLSSASWRNAWPLMGLKTTLCPGWSPAARHRCHERVIHGSSDASPPAPSKTLCRALWIRAWRWWDDGSAAASIAVPGAGPWVRRGSVRARRGGKGVKISAHGAPVCSAACFILRISRAAPGVSRVVPREAGAGAFQDAPCESSHHHYRRQRDASAVHRQRPRGQC